MDKLYKVVYSDELQPSGSTTNWNLCVLCQEETTEILKSPANSARDTEGAGYKTLAENLKAFNEIDCLPQTLKLSN